MSKETLYPKTEEKNYYQNQKEITKDIDNILLYSPREIILSSEKKI